MIIDTHAHYDDAQFDEDREQLLASMQAAGIGKIVNVGASMATTRTTFALVQKHDFMWAAIGVHPDDCGDITDEAIAELREMAKSKKVVMIGEIGLDYHWTKENKADQELAFRRQLKLAVELDLPVSIHSRDAAEDTYKVIKEEWDLAKAAGKRLRGIIHCFAYSREMAEMYIELGFVLGVGGVVTFKNSKKLKEVVAAVPLEKIVLETDSPYLAPEPNRGKRNSSLNLPFVVAEIARLKGLTTEEVIAQTQENAEKLLGI